MASASTPLRFPTVPPVGGLTDPDEQAELRALVQAGLESPEHEDVDGDEAFQQVRDAHGRR